MGTEGVSKVMMIGGGTLGFLGFGGVAYTWGSVVKRWILNEHISVARPRRHWTRVERMGQWVGGGELGYDGRGWYDRVLGCGESCIHLGKCSDAMDIECTHRR